MVRPLLVLLVAGVAVAADVPLTERMLEDLRAANVARAALATENAAWAAERDRLIAARDGLHADAQRLVRDAEAAEALRDRAVQDLAALGAGAAEREPVEAALAAAATQVGERLAALARDLPPGAVITPRSPGFDEAVRALAASERALENVAIEIVPGRLGERTVAVKVLRVGGAAAWWLAMDGAAAGTLRRVGGETVLDPLDDADARAAIARAIAIVEQRLPATLELLPLPKAAP